MRLNCFFTLLPLLAVSSCTDTAKPSDGDVLAARQIPQEVAGDVQELVAANNRFTVDLYREIAGANSENLILSPFSVATAFGMVQAGARGATEAELNTVFGFLTPPERLHPAFGALLTSLDRGNAFGGYRLEVAQGLWSQTGYAFLDSYLNVLTGDYHAGEGSLNFSADPEAARKAVNDWVASHTQDRIKDLMPPGSITNLTRMVLANAIYFFGKWDLPFDPEVTRDEAFQLADGTSVMTPMMFQEETFSAHVQPGLSILDLAYHGDDLSMLCFVPNDLAAFEKALTYDKLQEWTGALQEHALEIKVPRFEIETDVALRDVLTAMGVQEVFSGSADLSGMDGTRDLSVSAAQHKAFIRVTEEGTEAAAATGVSVGVTSIPPHVYLNRPFFYVIRDRVTGSFLFAGRVLDPR